MRSNKDHSHATNVENFSSMLTYLATLGTRYNPSQDKLKLTYLQSRLTSTRTIMTALNTANQNDSAARDARRDLFETLAPLVVRVVRIFSLCQVSKDTIETAESLRKKIQGKRITPVKKKEEGSTPEDAEPKTSTHEAAQVSFMFLVQHFERLIATIPTATDYQPNEIELKLTSLQALSEQLQTANQNTDTKAAALDLARLNRNRALYRNEDGIVKVEKAVKKYVTAVFGPKSEEAVRINSFTFFDHDFNETAEVSPDPA